MPALILGMVLLATIVVTGVCSVYVVRTGHVAIIERGGSFLTVSKPGIHTKIPYLDRKRDVDLHPDDAHMTFTVKTRDNLMADVEVSVQYHVTQPDFGARELADASGIISQDDRAVSEIYRSRYAVRKPLDRMGDYVAGVLGLQAEEYTLADLFAKRNVIDGVLTTELHDKMLEYGFTVDDVLITDIVIPDDIKRSWERVAISRNEIDVRKNDAAASKSVEAIRAKGDADIKASEGRGIADRQRSIAEGMSDAIRTLRSAGLTVDKANDMLKFSQRTEMIGRCVDARPTVVIDGTYGRGKHYPRVDGRKPRKRLMNGDGTVVVTPYIKDDPSYNDDFES